MNLIVVHPDQMTDFVLDSGSALFQGRYTVGLWVWDLQAPSPAMADAASMVHEVWTPTSWGAVNVSAVFRGPVHRVAVPVDGQPSPRDRASIGLPDGFVVASSLDYDNGFVRQNTLGAVEAYTAAFSPADGHHLVIDTIHADRHPDEHAQLVGAVEGRPDVALRHTDGWSAAERDRVLASADCYLSLHRADGGLGAVAKAMSWGTFTVVTATTASLEFQTEQDSGLVRSEAASIPADEYRYPSGATWVEPDLQHASSLLRSAVSEAESTAVKVRRARQVAGRRFSRSVGAAAVRARLADIDDRLRPAHRADRVRPDRVRDHARGRR